MSTPAEKRFVNAKLSVEELTAGVRRFPGDRRIQWELRAARERFNQAREILRVERYGR